MPIINSRTVGTVRTEIRVQPVSAMSNTSNAKPSPSSEKVAKNVTQDPLKPVSTGVKKSPKAKRPPPNVFAKANKTPRKGSKRAKELENLQKGSFFALDKLAKAPKPARASLPETAPQPQPSTQQLTARMTAIRRRHDNIEQCLVPNKRVDLPSKKPVSTDAIAAEATCANSLTAIPGFEFHPEANVSKKTLAALASACGFAKSSDSATAHSRLQAFLFEAADLCARGHQQYLRSTSSEDELYFYISVFNQLKKNHKDDDSIDMSSMGPIAIRELMDALVAARYAFTMKGVYCEETRLSVIVDDKWARIWAQRKRM